MRKKDPRWSVRFELAPESPEEVRLHDFLEQLADKGERSSWIRLTLLAAIGEQSKETRSTADGLRRTLEAASAQPTVASQIVSDAAIEQMKKPEGGFIEVGPLSPNEVLRQRKLAAQQKLPLPKK